MSAEHGYPCCDRCKGDFHCCCGKKQQLYGAAIDPTAHPEAQAIIAEQWKKGNAS